MERIHYYSDYDMSIPMHIERMADVVRSYEDGNQPDGINDYLEMYHIVQFIEHGKYPQDWNENKIAVIKQYKGKVATYFSHLQSNDLPVIFGEIERGYESTIWQIIDQFKIKGFITENGLREILKEKSWLLKDLLEHRWIVEQNQILLTALLKENEHTAEWLLEQYVKEDRFSQHRDLYFPKSLTGKDKDTIVRNYVNSDKANLNYVRLVLVAKRSSEFPLHPLTIKDARKKEQILNKAILELGSIHVEYGSIDKDIVELTPPKKLTQTKSLITRRYCVLNKDNNEVWYLLHLLFGSQSMLFFVEPCKDVHFKNYYELLESGIDVRYDDYENYQKPYIDSLLDKGYLTKGEDGVLRCQKMQEIEVLKHLYEYRACSYWRYPKKEREILDEMVSKGWIEFDAHLLSPAEIDYFSYYLNNEKFTNGLAIRNNYAHGTTPSYSEKKHLHNYLQILVLFILLLLKISEDLDMKRYLGKYGLE